MQATATAVVAALVAAGCLADPRDEGGPAEPWSLSWSLEDCIVLFVAFPVPAERLSERLPEGFAPVPYKRATGDVLPGMARFDLDVYTCRSATGLASSPAEVHYGSFYAAATAPTRAEPGYQAQFVKWDFLVQDDARRAWLADQGLPARAGAASIEPNPAGQAAAAGHLTARLTLDGAGQATVTGLVAPSTGDASLDYQEFTPMADSDRLALWHAHADIAEVATGAARIVFTSGSWPAEVAGASEVTGDIVVARFTLRDGDVAVG